MADKHEYIDINFNDRWPTKLIDYLSVMQVSQFKFWEKERMNAMYTAIRPDDVILDIGTCNGEMSVVMASWLSDKGKMILVEPAAHFWPVIKGHFDANGLEPYRCLQVLASNRTTIFESQINSGQVFCPETGWPTAVIEDINPELGFAHLNDHAPNQPPAVPVMAIDDMGLGHVDIITMDIEGSEYEALQGAEKTILRDHPQLFISIHPEMMWREHHHSPDDLHVMLGKWGYDANYLGFDHEQHYYYKAKVRGSQI